MKKQSGFTLIELVMVIVILGILSAVALPKFVDLSADAQKAAVTAVAGAISSGSSINYGTRIANPIKGSAIATCANGSAVLDGGLPTGYSITTGTTTVAAGVTGTCTLSGDGSKTASFSLTGIL